MTAHKLDLIIFFIKKRKYDFQSYSGYKMKRFATHEQEKWAEKQKRRHFLHATHFSSPVAGRKLHQQRDDDVSSACWLSELETRKAQQ